MKRCSTMDYCYGKKCLNFEVDPAGNGQVARAWDFHYNIAYYLISSAFARWCLRCLPLRRYALYWVTLIYFHETSVQWPLHACCKTLRIHYCHNLPRNHVSTKLPVTAGVHLQNLVTIVIRLAMFARRVTDTDRHTRTRVSSKYTCKVLYSARWSKMICTILGLPRAAQTAIIIAAADFQRWPTTSTAFSSADVSCDSDRSWNFTPYCILITTMLHYLRQSLSARLLALVSSTCCSDGFGGANPTPITQNRFKRIDFPEQTNQWLALFGQ